MIKVKRKPRKCPQCGTARIADILYGMPIFDSELEKELKDGKIALGGCVISDNDPTWKCVDCGTNIYKEAKA